MTRAEGFSTRTMLDIAPPLLSTDVVFEVPDKLQGNQQRQK